MVAAVSRENYRRILWNYNYTEARERSWKLVEGSEASPSSFHGTFHCFHGSGEASTEAVEDKRSMEMVETSMEVVEAYGSWKPWKLRWKFSHELAGTPREPMGC